MTAVNVCDAARLGSPSSPRRVYCDVHHAAQFWSDSLGLPFKHELAHGDIEPHDAEMQKYSTGVQSERDRDMGDPGFSRYFRILDLFLELEHI